MDIFEDKVEQYKRELMKYAKKNGTLYAEKSDGFEQIEAPPHEQQKPQTHIHYMEKFASDRPMPKEYDGSEDVSDVSEYEKKEHSRMKSFTQENKAVPVVVTPSNAADERETETDINTGEAPAEERYGSYEEFIADNPKTGKLRVQTFAARQAFPVQGARITVEKDFDNGVHTFSRTITDVDGISENIELPTKDKNLSQSPGNDIPYSTYTVRVEHPQFIPLSFYNVPIFDSVESLQPVSMLPKGGRTNSSDNTRQI